jgi:hypothetical protein
VCHTVNWGLAAQLLQHLGSTGQSVTRLANANVEDELLDREIPHGVLRLFRHCCGCSVVDVVGLRRVRLGYWKFRGSVPSQNCLGGFAALSAVGAGG